MAVSKFKGIYKDIKSRIEAEEYIKDSLLPSEHQLISEYNCSRNTVRRAIAQLAEEGYVQSMHGRGVQVIYQAPSRTAFTFGGIESFAETAKRNNLDTRTEVLQFTELVIDERTAKKTGLPSGSTAFYIQRKRILNGKAVIFDINLMLKSEMPALTKEIAERSIYSYLENDLQMQITTSNRRISAERATPADLKHLALGDYDFVAVVTSQTYNSKGVQFEWTQSRHHPDYFCFYDTAIRKI
ncbi:MAG: trehalose operon repressor [Eubacteriales bacterium]|nr:trehalose operon repressor [Eubacteriales bacterium]